MNLIWKYMDARGNDEEYGYISSFGAREDTCNRATLYRVSMLFLFDNVQEVNILRYFLKTTTSLKAMFVKIPINGDGCSEKSYTNEWLLNSLTIWWKMLTTVVCSNWQCQKSHFVEPISQETLHH